VRVNAICPGLIEVNDTTEQERQEMANQIPFGRPGRPGEIAEVVRWLVIESPPYLTGAITPVAGAWEY
jgi:3-oxoacyl-[acyl-carrier protein] reductase